MTIIHYNFYIFSSNEFIIVSLLSECPKESPTGKCIGNKRCEYGEECCCGKCHPSFVSTCLDGQWLSFYTDACRNAHLVCGNKYQL